MTAETFNEFGSRYGYPIYVFSDGTFASSRINGKRVIFTVEGPIDTNPAHQRQLPSRSENYPTLQSKNEQDNANFWHKIKQKAKSIFSQTEYTDYTQNENVKDVVSAPKQETYLDRRDKEGKTFFHQGKDWSVRAEGVSEVKTYHAKDGDREVFVANYKF